MIPCMTPTSTTQSAFTASPSLQSLVHHLQHRSRCWKEITTDSTAQQFKSFGISIHQHDSTNFQGSFLHASRPRQPRWQAEGSFLHASRSQQPRWQAQGSFLHASGSQQPRWQAKGMRITSPCLTPPQTLMATPHRSIGTRSPKRLP